MTAMDHVSALTKKMRTLHIKTDSMRNDAVKDELPTGRAKWIMIFIMYASNLMASFNQSLMNIALDTVASDYGISLSVANWVILGFTIVAGTLITMAAAILKRFGIRKVMFFGYICSLVGSILGFFAFNFPILFIARLIQAVTVGLFFPVATAVILTISPPDKRGTLLAMNSAVIGVGLAFAPLISGSLLTYAGLRYLFLVPIGFSIVLLVVGIIFLHDIYARQRIPIDKLSIILSFVGFALGIYGLNNITRDFLIALGFLVAGIIVLLFFCYRQTHIKDPMLNLQPMKHFTFVFGEILMMLGYMSSIYMSLLVPLYLEGTAGVTAFVAGAYLVVPILCYAASCYVGGRIEDKHGIWPLVPAGFIVILAAFIVMEITSSMELVLALVVCAAFGYAGVGLVFPTLKAFDLSTLPRDIYSHGSSIHSLLVQVANSLGSAIFVGIMSADVDALQAHGVSKAEAYASGFSHTLIIDIVILIVAVGLAIFFALKFHRHRHKDGLVKQNPQPSATKAGD